MKTCTLNVSVSLVVGLLLSLPAPAFDFQQQTDLSDWLASVSDPEFADAQTDGDTFTFSLASAETADQFADLKSSNADPIGIMASFNIEAVSGDGHVSAGIIQNVGKTGEHFVRTQLDIANDDQGRFRIRYRLRSRQADGTDGVPFSEGEFGGTSDVDWQTGDDIFIGTARVGDEIWYYMEGQPAIVKYLWVQPSEPPLESAGEDGAPVIFGFADSGAGNAISGHVKHIFLVYE